MPIEVQPAPTAEAAQPDDAPIGVMICGHGSRDADAVREFAAIRRGVAERLPQYPVSSGFLEFATPIIADGLAELRDAGVKRVLAVPGMLFAAGHVKNDVPSVLRTWETQHPGVSIEFGRDLGIDTKLIRAAGERIEQAIAEADAASGETVPRHETLLVVVGRGSSDPDANSNISKVMRMLWEGHGFGWAETAYSGVTFPLVEPALEHVARMGYRRVIVFPYFLFTGVLIKRIYRYTDEVAARHPGIEFLKASYLNDHPLVLDAFAERVTDILGGENNMNCKLCKYREQVLGFEAEQGLAQESHHHHVEGIGLGGGELDEHDNGHKHAHDPAHGHDHAHGHAHDHGHTHHPYPHADHPHGPRSMER